MPPSNSDPLLIGLAAGDERAFAVAYEQFGTRLLRTAMAMLGRRQDAEDAVQEVFVGLVRSRRRLAEIDDLTAYLFTALRHAAAAAKGARIMCDESLPSDLRRVEHTIGSLMRLHPQAEFDRRILGEVHEQLRRERIAARWKFTLYLATGAFLWLHLSFYAARATDFHFGDASYAARINPLAAGSQAVVPNWSCDE